LKEGMSRQEIETIIRQYADQEILFDQPVVNKYCQRITGPFSVESLPAPNINSNLPDQTVNIVLDQTLENQVNPIALSLTRNPETIRLNEWCEELYKTGIRGKNGEKINFSHIEILPGTQYIHAQAQMKQTNDLSLFNNKSEKSSKPRKSSKSNKSLQNQVILSFGQPYQALDQSQVKLAIAETLELIKEPTILVFCAFEFDPVASTYINKISNELFNNQLTVLKIQMNIDLLTHDLKKKRASNDSFWLVGQPDVKLIAITEGKNAGKYQIEILGFDYFNPQTGAIESGGKQQIIMWLLDNNYDGRCLYPHQVFFPLNSLPKNWEKLAKNLQLLDNLEYNSGILKTHESLISLPFDIGASGQIAVKIIDDRGLESLQIITRPI
jgi:adenine-specific DNA-methyltransferase